MFGGFKPQFSAPRQQTQEQAKLKATQQNIIVNIRKQAREDQIKKRRYQNTVVDTLPYKESSEPMTPLQVQIRNLRNKKFEVSDLGWLKENLQAEEDLGIRRVLSGTDESPPIQDVLDIRVLPEIIKLATQNQEEELKLEAVWTLSTLVSGDAVQTQTVVQKAGLELFVTLLQCKHLKIVQHALWAIGNLAADRAIYRDLLIKYGIIDSLIYLVNTSTYTPVVIQSCWSLSNIIRLNPLPPVQIVESVIIILCKVMLNQTMSDISIIKDILWGISYIIDNDEHQLDVFFNTGITSKLLELTNCGIDLIVVPALRNIGHLCFANKQQYIDLLIKQGIFNRFLQLIDSQKNSIKKQICWIASNIAASSHEHASALFSNAQLIDKFCFYLIHEEKVDIRIDSGYIFINIIKFGNPQFFTEFFLERKLLDVFLDIIENNQITNVIEMGLKGVNACLKLGENTKGNYGGESVMMKEFVRKNGVNILENAQDHEQTSIYELAFKILDGYFVINDPLKP